ncbi:hypothetical protein LCGC14_2769650, partial [marine sediment metagenome]
ERKQFNQVLDVLKENNIIFKDFIAETSIKERKKVKRAVGILVKAKCEKNKITLPYREARFPLMFGFGIDDVNANLEWLREVNRADVLDLKSNKEIDLLKKTISGMNDADFIAETIRIGDATRKVWQEIEIEFIPTRRKYQ